MPLRRARRPRRCAPPRRRHLKSMQLREAAHRSLLSAALRRREMLASLWNRASTAYRAKVGRELSNHGAARPRDRCADAAWIACWRPVALALGCRHRDFSDPRRDAPTSLPSCREAVGRIRWRSAGGSARRSQASGWRLSPCRHPRTFRLHPASPSPLHPHRCVAGLLYEDCLIETEEVKLALKRLPPDVLTTRARHQPSRDPHPRRRCLPL